MKLNIKDYRDKVYACWMGKNMGGTMGAPYEGTRSALNVTGFVTRENEILPNDDLDLQLVWLHAVEFEGPRNISAEVLGEYWLSFITGYWNEYGIARRNMERGIIPPVCGEAQNAWKHSNGAWIRTEIWATLAPAYPDLAVRFALEDAKVDHGTGEGTYAAAFVAALESAAFVISDIRELIKIGLAKIPAQCRMAQTVRLALTCYDEGKTPQEARDAIWNANQDIGDGWFQAPSNVGYVVIGLLYGEGDFKKSMLTALNFGDDTDCTAGTVGAIMGIMYGSAGLPEDWRKHIGEEIVTGTINKCVSMPIVKNCVELTDKVVSLAPSVLRFNKMNALTVELGESEEITESDKEKFLLPYGSVEETDGMRTSLFSLKENTFQKRLACVTVLVTYENGVEISPSEEKKISIRVVNNVKAYGNQPYTVRVKVWLPDGFETDTVETDIFAPQWTPFTKDCVSEEKTIVIKAAEKLHAVNKILLEVSVQGRYTEDFVPVVFTAK